MRRLSILLVTVLALGLGLGACGGSGSPSSTSTTSKPTLAECTAEHDALDEAGGAYVSRYYNGDPSTWDGYPTVGQLRDAGYLHGPIEHYTVDQETGELIGTGGCN